MACVKYPFALLYGNWTWNDTVGSVSSNYCNLTQCINVLVETDFASFRPEEERQGISGISSIQSKLKRKKFKKETIVIRRRRKKKR